ncbi:hypothetical protein QAD02_001797 [Eretmocerus hayati]|uniref:Uncharacterized protein n=1 Tax=Eretmocerus hayati TaxID=131215 RepID=A0ACC2NH70_9HYME|nr:hypothetical protein QAD02_001797 [Eretmocerus hayati]
MSTSSVIVSSSMSSPSTIKPRLHKALLQEKQDLAKLNGRLARYVNKVQLLEAENLRLARKVLNTKEVLEQEKATVEKFYKSHLSDARDHHKACVREKAKLEMQNKQLLQEKKDLKNKLEARSKDLQMKECSLTILESRCNRIQSQCDSLQVDRKKLTNRESELEEEIDRLSVLLDKTKKFLENESLLRAKLESRNESLQNDINFKEQMHQSEIAETRSKHQIIVSEIDSRLTKQYEKQREIFENLQNQFEGQMFAHQEAIKNLHEMQVRDDISRTHQKFNPVNVSLAELQQNRKRIIELNAKVADLETVNTALSRTIRHLEQEKEIQQNEYENSVVHLESQLIQFKDDKEELYRRYTSLEDEKVDLRLEITAYKKLLGLSGEARLVITPLPTVETCSSHGEPENSSRLILGRDRKRKHVTSEVSDEDNIVSNETKKQVKS